MSATMIRRATFSVTVRLPHGTTNRAVQDLIEDAIKLKIDIIRQANPSDPLAGLEAAEMQVKLTHKETKYL